jgi:protein-S-isoprenylcysteine O-methyltransferase Ste14
MNRLLSTLELKLSPVMLAVLLAGLMWLLARNATTLAIAAGWRWASLAVLAGAGLAIGAAGIWSFRKARTTVNPWRPDSSSTLVKTGIYRRTRNPMYLGLMLALAGWGLYLASPQALLLACCFVPYMNRFQIRPEERALEKTHGQEFRAYCNRVRRWI